jgi:aryl-alcohol dehydrogenase-like predicted oxidoreductase
MAQIEPLLAAMKKISESHSVPVSAVALNWVICKGVIPLAGAKNGKQAEANSKAMGWRLSEEEVKELDGLAIEGANTWTWQHG